MGLLVQVQYRGLEGLQAVHLHLQFSILVVEKVVMLVVLVPLAAVVAVLVFTIQVRQVQEVLAAVERVVFLLAQDFLLRPALRTQLLLVRVELAPQGAMEHKGQIQYLVQ